MRQIEKRKSPPAWIELFFFVVAAFPILALGLCKLSPETVFFLNDQALSSAVGIVNASGEPSLSGPPAALGGRHPGPYHYYWEGLLALLAGGDIFRAAFLGTLLKAFGLIIFFWGCARIFRAHVEPIVTFSLLSLSVLSGMWWWILRVPWHSNMLFLLSGGALLSLFSLANGNIVALGTTLVIVSLLAASHFAAWPAAAGIALTAIVIAAQAPARSELKAWFRSKAFFISLLALMLVWIPSAWYSLEFHESIFPFAAKKGRHHGSAGLFETLELLARFWRVFTLGDSMLWRFTQASVGIWSSTLFVLGAYFAKRQPGPLRTLYLLIFFESLLYIPTLTILRSPLKLHYLQSLALIPPLALALTLPEITRAIKTTRFLRKEIFISSWLFIALGLMCLLDSTWANFNRLGQPTFQPYESLAHAQEVASIIANECKRTNTCETLKIRTSGDAKNRRNGYLLFLGEKYFHSMNDAWKLREHARFRKASPHGPTPVTVFDVSCVAQARVGNVDISACSTCGLCTMTRTEK